MFDPKYNISTKLLANIKRITELVYELNHLRFSKVVLAELEKNANEISVFSSTSIEGNPLPITEVKKILKNKPEHARDSEKEVLNYNKALVDLKDNVKKEISFNFSFILGVHKKVTDGLVPKFDCGKVRQKPVFVNDPIVRKTIYWPPDHNEAGDLLKELVFFVKRNKNLDPLLLAGIFHKQFVIVHPFIDGNGRTVRLLTQVLLASLGLDLFDLFSFENYYNKNVQKYFEMVGVKGNYYDIHEDVDFTLWLEYFTDGIIDELLRVQKELNKQNIPPETEIKTYHKSIIRFIEENGFIRDSDYAKLTERARSTRNVDFKKLIDLGYIESHGKGKGMYYKLKV